MKESLEDAIERLERTSSHLREQAGVSNQPREIFLRSWARLLKARAEWIWEQRMISFLSCEDILKLSQMELEIADSFQADPVPLTV